MKTKILDFIVDVLLLAAVFGVTDAVALSVFHSESTWLHLGLYIVFYAIAFGAKQGVVTLWNRRRASKKN